MVKLKDIHVDDGQIHEFARLHSFDGRVIPSLAPGAEVFYDSTIGFATYYMLYSKWDLHAAIKRTVIQDDCDISPDFSIIVQAFAYLNSYPDARKMLWHYLTGTKQGAKDGVEVEVDTARVFNEDYNMKTYALSEIYKSLESGSASTMMACKLITDREEYTINFQQPQYSSQNWKNAFGAINIKWEKIRAKINVWFVDTYQWHPDEPRTTQCVHMAMDRARRYGAHPFPYHGTKLQFDIDYITRYAKTNSIKPAAY